MRKSSRTKKPVDFYIPRTVIHKYVICSPHSHFVEYRDRIPEEEEDDVEEDEEDDNNLEIRDKEEEESSSSDEKEQKSSNLKKPKNVSLQLNSFLK